MAASTRWQAKSTRLRLKNFFYPLIRYNAPAPKKHNPSMSERKQQILKTAIEIIIDEGYGCLTMRALARASNIKLGALQYHFRTTDEMLKALVEYVAESYHQAFDLFRATFEGGEPGVRDIVMFLLRDEPGNPLYGDKLWPQLWAMQQVEPLVSELVEDIYEKYLTVLQVAMTNEGTPTAEALPVLALIEGSTIFVGSGRRWESEGNRYGDLVLQYVDKLPSNRR